MPVSALLLLTGALAACALLVGLALDLSTLRVAVKALPALCIAAWVWQAGAERRIALGLAFGALGDLCLALPGGFLAGMVAFAIGHGLYVWTFWRWQPAWRGWLVLPVVLYLGTMLTLMLPGTGDLMWPVAIYMSIIGAMIWRACAIPNADAAWRDWLAPLGALLFAFSDTLIGINKFVVPLANVSYAIIISYWAGQWLIGAAAVVRRR